MARTPAFSRLVSDFRLAYDCARTGVSTAEGLERRAAGQLHLGRRAFAAGLVGAAASLIPRPSFAGPGKSSLDVGIVGAGLAGLTCANELYRAGVTARLYDANDRAGGRCWSLSGLMPGGQVIERGGELIDNLHKTMLGFAKELGLTREDVNKYAGDVLYYFDGKPYKESQVVAEYREFVEVMRKDLTQLSGEPSALAANDHDRLVDRTSLADYLDGMNAAKTKAGPLVRAAVAACYAAEYGLPIEQQSALNFLLFIHADKRGRFQPWGVFSDERFHIVEGNDRIAQGLASRVESQIDLGHALVKVEKTAAGRYQLTFKKGATTVVKTHDHVVLAVPFTVLRNVTLDPSLGLPQGKVDAIRNLGYGDNAKMMIACKSKPWVPLDCNGASYSDLANHQTTWETNPSKSTATNAVITDYSSGPRGRRLAVANAQSEARAFLRDFDKLVPGAATAGATDAKGRLIVHLEPWPNNPLTKGSYTCYTPGQFTTIAGLEGQTVGKLRFAGEHTDSFYGWQGFMEGACLSGIAAAQDILR